jgi:hypothetical protein
MRLMSVLRLSACLIAELSFTNQFSYARGPCFNGWGEPRVAQVRREFITRPSMMGRNTLDAFRQQIGGRRMADIAETEDADHPFALVDNR